MQERPRKRSLVLCLVGLTAAGCGVGHRRVGGELVVPTADNVPPAPIRATSFALSGSRAADTEVWVRYGSGNESRIATAASSAQWGGALALVEGNNAFSLVARVPNGHSQPSSLYVIVRDTTPPPPPVVNAPDGVFINGKTPTSFTLTGTRAADGDLQLGGTEVLPIDGSTTWSVPVTVSFGANNQFTFASADSLGNTSSNVVVNLFGTNLPPPTIDPNSYQASTSTKEQTLRGGKPQGTDLYFVLDGGTPVRLGLTTDTTWSYSFVLPAVGQHAARLYVTQPAQLYRSPSAVAAINLLGALAAPIINSPDFSKPLPDTGADHLTISGSAPAGATVCVSSVPQGQCDLGQTSVNPDGSFSVSVPLGSAASRGAGADGTNPLYVSSRNGAGGSSVDVSGTIYRDAVPTIGSIVPPDGAVIGGNSLTVTVQASANAADSNHTSAAIDPAHGVQVCLDTVHCVAAALSGGAYVGAPLDTSSLANGSPHTVTVTVTSAVGAQAQQTVNLVYSNGAPVWVSNEHSGQPATQPRAAFDGLGNLHVVWQDYCAQAGASGCTVPIGAAQQPPDIFYARRSKAGVWSSIASLSSTINDGDSESPALAVDAGNNVHVVWSETGTVAGKPSGAGIVRRTVPAGGGAPGAIDAVAANTTGIDDVNPSVAFDPASGLLHVAWTRKTNANHYDIMVARNGGSAWSAPLSVTGSAPTTLTVGDRASVVATPSGHAVVAWQTCSSDPNATAGRCTSSARLGLTADHDILLQEVASASALGYGPILVSDQSKSLMYDGDSLQPSLGVDPSYSLWVAWADTGRLQGQTSRSIWSRQFVPGNAAGQQLQAYTLVSQPSGGSNSGVLGAEQPALTLGAPAGGAVPLAVVWTQSVSSSNSDIWANVTTTANNFAAVTSSAVPHSVIATPALSLSASCALDAAGHLHAVWDDSSSYGSSVNPEGIDQIFYQEAP